MIPTLAMTETRAREETERTEKEKAVEKTGTETNNRVTGLDNKEGSTTVTRVHYPDTKDTTGAVATKILTTSMRMLATTIVTTNVITT